MRKFQKGGQKSPHSTISKTPIIPKPLNQSISNKKVTPITFYSESKSVFKISKGGSKKPPPLKTEKMPIAPKPLNQSTSNKMVTLFNFFILNHKHFQNLKRG